MNSSKGTYPIESDLEIRLLKKESLGELSDTSDGEDWFSF